ncbi:MAG TPA: YceI family protein [Pseudomonadales bacterium]|nr:YceI family protein [Pseudomonadales bacterium]
MRSRSLVLGTLMVVVGALPPALAAEPWVSDLSHTRITFDIDHLGYSVMPGMFRDFDVDFQFDPDAPADSSLDVTIDAASIDMYHDGLNEHLRKPDFFDVENHPTLTFVSTEVVPTSASTATVTGDMTLLGVTHPVTFEVTMNKLGPHPFNGSMVAGFSATGTLDRTAFGMDYAAPLVGSEVRFTLTGEFSPPAEDE